MTTSSKVFTKRKAMSNSTCPSEIRTPVSHNVYFEGYVQSLGFSTEKGPATIGVMKKGAYQFNTSSPETIIVVSGKMSTRVKDGDWRPHLEQETFEISSDAAFDIICETDVAYICYYR
jgi:purine/pyrimidine-nucleoside phosphorylase